MINWHEVPPLDLSLLEKPVAFTRKSNVTQVPSVGALCDKPLGGVKLPGNLKITLKSSVANKKSKHTEKTIQRAMALHFDWQAQELFFNVDFAGGIADVVVLSKARYLTEVEIKISMSDWNADQHKAKWQHPSRHKVCRMYYAVPDWMAAKIPAWVPETVGIFSVGETGWVKEVRPATRMTKYKASLKDLSKFYRSIYYKYTSHFVSKHNAS